ncbi:hypothetical protein [Xenorhabdus bovienii]|nr:hypothetical protein [Xenorhabdus bovienii]
MIDINEELEKINKAKFFSNMGLFNFYDENVEKAFIIHSDNEF